MITPHILSPFFFISPHPTPQPHKKKKKECMGYVTSIMSGTTFIPSRLLLLEISSMIASAMPPSSRVELSLSVSARSFERTYTLLEDFGTLAKCFRFHRSTGSIHLTWPDWHLREEKQAFGLEPLQRASYPLTTTYNWSAIRGGGESLSTKKKKKLLNTLLTALRIITITTHFHSFNSIIT